MDSMDKRLRFVFLTYHCKKGSCFGFQVSKKQKLQWPVVILVQFQYVCFFLYCFVRYNRHSSYLMSWEHLALLMQLWIRFNLQISVIRLPQQRRAAANSFVWFYPPEVMRSNVACSAGRMIRWTSAKQNSVHAYWSVGANVSTERGSNS